jgi:hypothetical protein
MAAPTTRAGPGLRLSRAPFLLLGILSLLVGAAGGLARIGWDLGALPPGAIASHGPLMVAGFLGTLIGLERAVAYGRRWAYSAPLLTGAGALLVIASDPAAAGRGIVAVGAAAACAVLVAALYRHPSRWTATQAVGAASFAVGCALWAAGWSVPRLLPWWQAFLVLTIVGERLELSRILQPTRAAMALFSALVGLEVLAALLSSLQLDWGVRLGGVAWLGLALWLGRWDLARRALRSPGLPRFMATAVLSGHVWLGAAGVLALAFGGVAAGPAYDAVVHALFMGFVFAMIFGHAPVIFPSVLGLPLAFRGRFYAHLALLHAGVLLRVASDLAGSALLFLVQTVTGFSLRRPEG